MEKKTVGNTNHLFAKSLREDVPLEAQRIIRLIHKCYEVQDGKSTWTDVSDFAIANGLNMSGDYIRQGCRILFAARAAGIPIVEDVSVAAFRKAAEEDVFDFPAEVEASANGNTTHSYNVPRETLRELFEAGDLSEKKVRKHFGIPNELVIERMKYQKWHSALKGGGTQEMYNIRLDLRPKISRDISESDIEAFFERKQGKLEAFPAVPPLTPHPSSRYGELVIADPHVGLLAWDKETGRSYDMKIAKKRMTLIARAFVDRHTVVMPDGTKVPEPFKAINLALLGDILHVDTAIGTTTHGTKQDVEGRIPKMIDTAVEALTEIIVTLQELQCPIRVTFVPGNHDQILGYSMIRVVQEVFRKNPNISFDVTPSIYKVVRYGNTVVGLSHGEAPDKRAHTPLINEFRELYGQAQYAEFHGGHLHSFSANDHVGGIQIFRLPAICESSYWEKSKGYPAAERGSVAFLYDETQGRTGIEFYYCDRLEEAYAAPTPNRRKKTSPTM